jgi:hypothetical protein
MILIHGPLRHLGKTFLAVRLVCRVTPMPEAVGPLRDRPKHGPATKVGTTSIKASGTAGMSADIRGLVTWILLILLVATLIWCVHQWRRYRQREPSLVVGPATRAAMSGEAGRPSGPEGGRPVRLGLPIGFAVLLILVLVALQLI